MTWAYAPFLLQGIFMGIDEYLHKKRDLGLWERLGHPLDTLTVFVPLSYVAINEYDENKLIVFIILSVFSCFFITKDEFVHSKVCQGLETWVHSILFILHPFIFIATLYLWRFDPKNEFLNYQPLIVGPFMIYQIARWSIPWKSMRQ